MRMDKRIFSFAFFSLLQGISFQDVLPVDLRLTKIAAEGEQKKVENKTAAVVCPSSLRCFTFF